MVVGGLAQSGNKIALLDTLQSKIDQALTIGDYQYVIDSTSEWIPKLKAYPLLTDRLAQLMTTRGTALRRAEKFEESLKNAQVSL